MLRPLVLAMAMPLLCAGVHRGSPPAEPTDWPRATAVASGVRIKAGALALDGGREGTWTGAWQRWEGAAGGSVRLVVDAHIPQFANKTIEVLVSGSQKPFTDADGVAHDWYGRCMIAIVDENRWLMALRSGVDHIRWGMRDAIHLLASNDEGRTWGALNRWFDGSQIAGSPFEDGHTHSEPGLYRMPGGDLVLQFWRTGYTSGTKQLRSSDQGKTWRVDLDRIVVAGVTGADGARAIGTQDWFADPDHPDTVYMAFEYFHYGSRAGTLLARSKDDGRSYTFLSWITPLADEKDPESGAAFEPAIEYVGRRSIVAVLRGYANNRTWQAASIDMGASFGAPADISRLVDGGVAGGLWQRPRLYKESNSTFQHGNRLSHARGEGRLWGFGLHSVGGGYTRKPAVYWSDNDGHSWRGPELLHGDMFPGTDTGYGDMKRRRDGTFVAATYYANADSTVADLEQYTFGGDRGRARLELDDNGDDRADRNSRWFELYDGRNVFDPGLLAKRRWRVRIELSTCCPGRSPRVGAFELEPER